MGKRKDLQDFVRDCNLAKTEEQLFHLLDEETRRLGFEQFALTHHVDLGGPPEDAIALWSYHRGWEEKVVANRYYLDDPIFTASSKTAGGFLWTDVGKMISLTDRQKEILEGARKFGLNEGYTVPVHVPGEYRGTCNFGARSLEKLPSDSIPRSHVVGAFAFEAARRIVRARRSPEADTMPQLTSRQIDCVTLVAMGKTDWEIGRILGISEATAHEHIESARRRYGVAKRTQLIVRALYDGQIAFSDIIH